MRGLSEKVIVVAGGGSGIGAASAIRLGEEGASVVVGDINPNAAEAVAASIIQSGGRAVAQQFDAADDSSNAALVGRAIQTYGRLDGIHLNVADMATSLKDSDVLSLDMAVFDRLVEVNLRGHVSLTRHALPELLKCGGGSMVYTTSTVTFVGLPTYSAYPISKSGLNSLVRHVATAWGQQGIRCNGIAPGMVLSEHVRSTSTNETLEYGKTMTMSPRLGEPSDIAAMAAFLHSEDAFWVNGQILAVDGGATMRQ